MNPSTRRILIVNGKGGCGKTTIATNLAVAYANRGMRVALVDNDPQASSSYWSEQRNPDLAPVTLVRAHQRSTMYQTQTYHNRVPANVDRVIVDGHSYAQDRDLETLLKQSDVILVPLMPSAIDIRAAGQFITSLLTHRVFRNAPRPVGVIANRVRPNTAIHKKLLHFLGCLDVPSVATFRDSKIYTDAVEHGMGISDMKDSRTAVKETSAWWKLLDWIDQQSRSTAATQRELRSQPRAAPPHYDERTIRA
ncbi:MAG: ParA family protein [Gammaproteobacteria bacterium]|nr:ParA family protein [Gammaproteobacteria bacterium]